MTVDYRGRFFGWGFWWDGTSWCVRTPDKNNTKSMFYSPTFKGAVVYLVRIVKMRVRS